MVEPGVCCVAPPPSDFAVRAVGFFGSAGRFFRIALTSRLVSATFDTSNGGDVLAMSGSRCCGGECNGCTCTPSVWSAPKSAPKPRLSTLSAVCVLVFAAHVATAQAQDAPPPPVTPTVPTVAVEVSVSVPGVTLVVEDGTVDISVSTASVDVSVSVSSEDTSSSPEKAGAPPPQQSPPPVELSNCCAGDAKNVALADTAAKATPAPAAKRLARPTIPAANGPRAHPTRVARVDPPKRVLTSKRGPSHTSERPAATRPAGRRGCCEHAQASVVVAAAEQDLGPRPRAEPRPSRFDRPQVRPVAALLEEHVRDNRLLLQLGVLAAFLYLVCLAAWFLRHNAEAEEGMSTRTRP